MTHYVCHAVYEWQLLLLVFQLTMCPQLCCWLLATASLAPEDTASWSSITPAAARSTLGAISSLDSVAKQSARAGLLASNTVPLKVPVRHSWRGQVVRGAGKGCWEGFSY
jgi:hypothetical protein